jgi:hypothetical protein
MTTVPFLPHHNGGNYALQYDHATEADAIAEQNERAKTGIVRLLGLDQRYYGFYTASTIEKHSTEAPDLSDRRGR